MQARVAIIAVVLGLMVLVAWASNGKSAAPKPGRDAAWDIMVPPSCAKQALAWMGGNAHLNDYPVQEFLKLKTKIEGCGGHVALAQG